MARWQMLKTCFKVAIISTRLNLTLYISGYRKSEVQYKPEKFCKVKIDMYNKT